MIISKCISFLALLTFVSMNEEMTLEEKRIENAMFAMVGEKVPHEDVPVEPHYMNPADLLLTSISKAREERERKSSGKVTVVPALAIETTTQAVVVSKSEHPHQKQIINSVKTWFHIRDEEVILFDFWKIGDRQGLVISCVIIFIMGIFYEGLKKFRLHLTSLKGRTRKDSFQLPTVVTVTDGRALKEDFKDFNTPLVDNAGKNTQEIQNAALFSCVRIGRGLVYILELALACSLILIVMTYNFWLALAVVLGAGFGHWIFE